MEDAHFRHRFRPSIETFDDLLSGLYFVERWSVPLVGKLGWPDSVYFVIVTFTTIGCGDFTPTLPVTKLLTIIAGLNGITTLLLLIDEIRLVRTWRLEDHPG